MDHGSTRIPALWTTVTKTGLSQVAPIFALDRLYQKQLFLGSGLSPPGNWQNNGSFSNLRASNGHASGLSLDKQQPPGRQRVLPLYLGSFNQWGLWWIRSYWVPVWRESLPLSLFIGVHWGFKEGFDSTQKPRVRLALLHELRIPSLHLRAGGRPKGGHIMAIFKGHQLSQHSVRQLTMLRSSIDVKYQLRITLRNSVLKAPKRSVCSLYLEQEKGPLTHCNQSYIKVAQTSHKTGHFLRFTWDIFRLPKPQARQLAKAS